MAGKTGFCPLHQLPFTPALAYHLLIAEVIRVIVAKIITGHRDGLIRVRFIRALRQMANACRGNERDQPLCHFYIHRCFPFGSNLLAETCVPQWSSSTVKRPTRAENEARFGVVTEVAGQDHFSPYIRRQKSLLAHPPN